MNEPVFDKSLINLMPEAIGIADIDGRIHFVNDRFTSLFGYTQNEIPNLEKWVSVAYPDENYREESYKRWKVAIEDALQTGAAQEPGVYQIQCKDQTIRIVEIAFSIKDNLILTFFRDVTLLVKAKEELVNERNFSENLINSLPGVFFLFQKTGTEFKLVQWNKNFERLSTYSVDELFGRPYTDFIASEDQENANKVLYSKIGGNPLEIELNLVNKQGKKRPYLMAGYTFLSGNSEFFLGIGIDIARSKETEENLGTLVGSFPDIIMVIDFNGLPLFANKSLENQTGYTLNELLDRKNKIILHPPEDRELITSAITDLLQSDKTQTDIIENRLIDKKGNILWYSGVIAKTTFNGEPALLLISRNITSTKFSENKLVESEKRMSAVFDGAPVIMMLVNEKQEILQINKKGLQELNLINQQTGYSNFGQAYKCIHVSNIEHGCDSGSECRDCMIRKTINDTFTNGTEHLKVEVNLHSSDSEYHLLLSTTLLRAEEPKEALVTVDNITERKKIEVELKRSQEKAVESDKLKSAFLQNMSHEIRTPLNGILGFSGLLNNDELNSDDRRYYIEVINQSSNQLLSIVDDILSISRLETGQIEIVNEQVNLNALMQDIFLKFNKRAADRNLIISHYKDLNDRQSQIYTDSAKLSQILTNLLSNALKFTHQGHVLMGYKLKDETLEFYVEDTGIGIAPEWHQRIFERFHQVESDATRAYGGTGLGLTIAKGNVEILGGKIWLESEPGAGSKFYFTLPYNPVNEEPVEQTTFKGTPVSGSSGKPLILVAEDEEINYLFIEVALKELNCQIIHVYDGVEAIEQVSLNENISLVLMDIKMPNMDGYTALETIRQMRPNLPVVAQTAYAMLSDREKALKAGFTEYLAKPIRSNDLVAVVSKYI